MCERPLAPHIIGRVKLHWYLGGFESRHGYKVFNFIYFIITFRLTVRENSVVFFIG